MATAIQDLQRHVIALTGATARVEGKLDAFLKKMEDQDERLTDIDKRMRTVENHQYRIAGASTVLGMLAGAMVSFAGHWIKS